MVLENGWNGMIGVPGDIFATIRLRATLSFKTGVVLTALAGGAYAPPVAAQTPEPATHVVEIKSFAFQPAKIEIRTGETVVWTNRDFAPHTATADDAGWDTGPLKGEATGRFVAGEPGTFAYHCKFHPRMTGSITVLAR